MSGTATLRAMIALGLTDEQKLTLLDAIDEDAAVAASNAERQRRYRERLDVSAAEWSRIRAEVFERDGYTCQYCRATDSLACDHVVPLCQGGKSTLDNLVTACKPCNSAKSGRTPRQWLA